MPELLLELFSEEIPARMQARAAEDLARLVGEALAALSPAGLRSFHGPRRIALAGEVAAATQASRSSERGPRVGAPEQALAGFVRKHGADRDALRQEGGFWVLEREAPAQGAGALVAAAMPGVLRRFPWPKSMRWGGSSGFTWVRPLRRILCLLDGRVVAFDLRAGEDDGHGLASGDLTEGHRFMAPGAVAVRGVADWAEALLARRVVPEAAERRQRIADGVAALASARGLTVVADAGLLDEVSGLVEWPVPLLGRIEAAFMDLPAEVMQVSMRVNQRYFALRDADGRAAPFFAFAANVEAVDGGAAIVAGNERVLRARFSDARHFWDLDRRTPLADRVAALEGVTFHARLGTQGARVQRLVALADAVARRTGARSVDAARAALLSKADLTTGMVGEFPELQGVMGGYYAAHDGEPAAVAGAVREHYLPKGPGDAVPSAPTSRAVALADKLDMLVAFFAIGEAPTGSGDPFALRRAALGVIRILREGGVGLPLLPVLREHAGVVLANLAPLGTAVTADGEALARQVLDFVLERLRVQLRGEGARHDVLAGVLRAGAGPHGSPRDGDLDDVNDLLARTAAVAAFLASEDGAVLLAGYKRAANILRIEEKRDGRSYGGDLPDRDLPSLPEEETLSGALGRVSNGVVGHMSAAPPRYAEAMSAMATLRAPIDAFFERVTVNDTEPKLRENRLRLLAWLRDTINQVADLSAIEG